MVAFDCGRLDANLHRFHAAAAALGVSVRSHIKAHRTIELSCRQVAAGAVGIAVQTAQAAVRLAEAGVTDVVVAWPWPDAWRFPHYVAAAERVPRFAVHVDRPEAITGIGTAAAARGVEVGVRVDLRHAGAAAAPGLAELAAGTPGIRLDGVTGYPALGTEAELADRDRLGQRYARQLVALAERVRAAGIECPVVSVGGTATAAAARQVPGVTEICAGAYATFDGGLAAAGVCAPEQVAVSVSPDAAELLAGCGQPWAPEIGAFPAAPPDTGRLAPAHICPLAVTLVRRGLEITVVEGGRPVACWRPFAAPDRRD